MPELLVIYCIFIPATLVGGMRLSLTDRCTRLFSFILSAHIFSWFYYLNPRPWLFDGSCYSELPGSRFWTTVTPIDWISTTWIAV